MRGRTAVAGQVEADDPPVAGQLRDLPVPHMPCGTQSGTQDEYGGIVGAVDPVLQGLLTHPATLPTL
ncbi:cell surface protein [Streptomyces lydicamycinicus]|uniref:Cell surface protein n=1 Tax=Streptomyces lydicamycinicus TaxID=1546107 RepID=A0A0P4RFA2_9ACTN|nr:cell surface protein [Streptomyces lydicamycinicus]